MWNSSRICVNRAVRYMAPRTLFCDATTLASTISTHHHDEFVATIRRQSTLYSLNVVLPVRSGNIENESMAVRLSCKCCCCSFADYELMLVFMNHLSRHSLIELNND